MRSKRAQPHEHCENRFLMRHPDRSCWRVTIAVFHSRSACWVPGVHLSPRTLKTDFKDSCVLPSACRMRLRSPRKYSMREGKCLVRPVGAQECCEAAPMAAPGVVHPLCAQTCGKAQAGTVQAAPPLGLTKVLKEQATARSQGNGNGKGEGKDIDPHQRCDANEAATLESHMDSNRPSDSRISETSSANLRRGQANRGWPGSAASESGRAVRLATAPAPTAQ